MIRILLTLILPGAYASADEISTTLDPSCEWACADSSGRVITMHTRQDKEVESYANRPLSDGIEFRMLSGSYRVQASSTSDSISGPIPDQDPPPDPDPIPTPVPSIQYRGIPDPSAVLGFDIDGEYIADQTLNGIQGGVLLTCNGTAARPCLIDASNASFTAVGVQGQYAILDGATVNANTTGGPFIFTEDCDKCVIRDAELSGPGVDAGHASAAWLGDDNVWLRGSIHGFGDNRAAAREQDFHGIKIQANNVWILDANIYDVSGDSIQCGDASRGNCTNVYIGGNFFHDNRENGVDIKDSTNVVVSGNTMSGFAGTHSDPGAAIVIHDDAFDAKIYDNIIRDARIGLVTSGVSGHEITGNAIEAAFRGIECRNTRNLTIAGNEIAAPTKIERQSNCKGAIQ